MEWIVQPCPWADEKHVITRGNKTLCIVEGNESEGEVIEFIKEIEAVEVAKALNKIMQW